MQKSSKLALVLILTAVVGYLLRSYSVFFSALASPKIIDALIYLGNLVNLGATAFGNYYALVFAKSQDLFDLLGADWNLVIIFWLISAMLFAVAVTVATRKALYFVGAVSWMFTYVLSILYTAYTAARLLNSYEIMTTLLYYAFVLLVSGILVIFINKILKKKSAAPQETKATSKEM